MVFVGYRRLGMWDLTVGFVMQHVASVYGCTAEVKSERREIDTRDKRTVTMGFQFVWKHTN